MGNKKHIIIMGDSYGVPYYYNRHNDPPETHISRLLEKIGHTVHNVSLAGCSNLQSIERCSSYIQGKPLSRIANNHALPDVVKLTDLTISFDLLIWFHTAILRDAPPTGRFNALNTTESLSVEIYKKFSELVSRLKCKTAVIGGAGPINTDKFYRFIQPELVIVDWKSEICGKKLPYDQTMGAPEQSSRFNDPIKTIFKLMNAREAVIQALYESEFFPDNSHPGKIPQRKLLKKLQEHFNI